ncbi:MAG: hypothetical protein JO253_06600, partial [Alphaproteobacteria bacterium]|nr:hypothetical protein [Alphaproteobacteria bacterium]
YSWNGNACVCPGGTDATGACACKLTQMDSGVTVNGGGILIGYYFYTGSVCDPTNGYPSVAQSPYQTFYNMPDCPSGVRSGSVVPNSAVPTGECVTARTCQYATGCGGPQCQFGAVWGLSCYNPISYPSNSCHSGGGGVGGGGCPPDGCNTHMNLM